MERITQKDLNYLVKRINEVTGSPQTPYTRTEGNISGNIGNYYLDYANGGVALVRIVNEGGAVTSISRSYHGTKRELYYFMQAFIAGLEHTDTKQETLRDAAREILSDFNRYGEVLQQGDNGEYGMDSAIGRLNTAL